MIDLNLTHTLEREREREREGGGEGKQLTSIGVGPFRTFYSNEAWAGYRVASGLDPIDSSLLTNEALKP